MKYSEILFDMDGTLFDTEKIYHAGWNAAGIPDSLYRQFIGRDRPHIFDLIRQNTMLDPHAVQAAKDAYVRKALERNEIPMKPHLIETLEWLKANGYHCCIATSSAREVAERYLAATGTGRYFDRVVSGNLLPHGKPAPDIYLLAAEEMAEQRSSHAGPDPAANKAFPPAYSGSSTDIMSSPADCCVVVEDSYNGVRAGHAAGMVTVMIPDEIPPDDEMRRTADVILHDLGELPAYLEALEKS